MLSSQVIQYWSCFFFHSPQFFKSFPARQAGLNMMCHFGFLAHFVCPIYSVRFSWFTRDTNTAVCTTGLSGSSDPSHIDAAAARLQGPPRRLAERDQVAAFAVKKYIPYDETHELGVILPVFSLTYYALAVPSAAQSFHSVPENHKWLLTLATLPACSNTSVFF